MTPKRRKEKNRVLLCGAGEAGRMIAREILNNPRSQYVCVGFLDDDPDKQGWELEGAPVLGPLIDLPQYVEEYQVDEVLLTIPSASGATIRHLAQLCDRADVPYRVLPSMFDVIHGDAKLTQVRDVRVEDLLRREPIRLDMGAIRHYVTDETVLVTGAGGSIGAELCRQLITFNPAKLVLLGHGENPIFEIHNELQRRKPRGNLVGAIVDLRDKRRLARILEVHHPGVIFHAAAHKHVPLMEDNPCEAFSNNVGSMLALAELAPRHGVERVVVISTDKAVESSNAMGSSKAVCEVIARLADDNSDGCRFISVRFGNVLGSRGSVIGVFQEQIERGGPITVTDPRMERFFMTIPEAVELVLQAAALGEGGEVFVLDMGQPLRIIDLAKMLVELSGYDNGEIPIEITGPRPGEKLQERLFSLSEERLPSPHPQLLIARSNGVHSELWQLIKDIYQAAENLETERIVELVARVCPESSWKPGEGSF
jgi:FlaA1/EpsC-like NDP-sugar epimerase